jgi:hypothetical protein
MKRILSDHRKVGKKLVPPFVSSVGPMKDVSWVRLIVPELIWIGIIHKCYGHKEAVKIITYMTRAMRILFEDDIKRKFCFASEWATISSFQTETFIKNNTNAEEFGKFNAAILPFVNLYPECPLSKIVIANPVDSKMSDLAGLSNLVSDMFLRESQPVTMIQATAIWAAFDSGQLLANVGTALARFPEIDGYPDTEVSQEIAAAIRTTLNMYAGIDLDRTERKKWSNYFWNRGFQLSGCNYAIK